MDTLVYMEQLKTHRLFYKTKYFVLGLIPLLCLCNCNTQVREDEYLVYTKAEKKYFMEALFYNGKTTKWNSTSLTFSIEGKFTPSQIEFIMNSLEFISALKGLPKFERVESNAKIRIHMPGSDKGFESSNSSDEKWRGFTTSKLGFLSRELILSEIFVKPTLTDLEVYTTLHHELLHALGLSGHPKSKFPFSSALGVRYFYTLEPEISPEIPEIDCKALMFLYNKKIPVKVAQTDVSILLGIK